MTTAIQFRRGSTDEHILFTGLEGEITVDTTKKTAIVHDNMTAGGIPLAREDLTNIPMQKIVDKGIAKSNMENVSCEDIANRNIAKQDLSNVSKETIISKGVMSDDCSNATQLATETNIGPTQFATKTETLTGNNNTKALTPKNATELIKKYITLPKNHISGFNLTKVSDSAIKIDCGEARSFDNMYDIRLTTPIVKQINTYWESGSNVGGLERNITINPNTQYYIFAIIKADYTIDMIISNEGLNMSTSIAASNGFVAYRLIGSFQTNQYMSINEVSTIDANDKPYVNTTRGVVFNPTSSHIYTAPFNGTVFYCSGLKNGAITNLRLNKTLLAVFENHSSGYTRSTLSFNVKKGDIINMESENDVNRDCILYLFKERDINNV
ncbi:hypothetical protein HDR60_00585 [bacterium]|nr:hypothetical protein [bacterium]